jgi:hypothetical protein
MSPRREPRWRDGVRCRLLPTTRRATWARAQRAYELGETSLAELLMSVRSANDTLHEQRMASLDAHEALTRMAIDAHELWAPRDDDHEH